MHCSCPSPSTRRHGTDTVAAWTRELPGVRRGERNEPKCTIRTKLHLGGQTPARGASGTKTRGQREGENEPVLTDPGLWDRDFGGAGARCGRPQLAVRSHELRQLCLRSLSRSGNVRDLHCVGRPALALLARRLGRGDRQWACGCGGRCRRARAFRPSRHEWLLPLDRDVRPLAHPTEPGAGNLGGLGSIATPSQQAIPCTSVLSA